MDFVVDALLTQAYNILITTSITNRLPTARCLFINAGMPVYHKHVYMIYDGVVRTNGTRELESQSSQETKT